MDTKINYSLTEEELNLLSNIRDQENRYLTRLQSLKPTLLDLSIREPSVGTALGHTVENKRSLLDLVKKMKFQDILLATFNYSLPDEPQPDDYFCQSLLDEGYDLTHCFAFTGVETKYQRRFEPDPSLLKLKQYRIPNTIIDIDLNIKPDNYPLLIDNLHNSIRWILDNILGDKDNDSKPRIYINYRDLPDAYHTAPQWVAEITKSLASLDGAVSAIAFEDPRGTYFPFQIGAMTRLIRSFIPNKMHLLVHIHSGNGMENACVIEALLAGANGAWSGFNKEAAFIGHASNAELLANLARCGNEHLGQYAMTELLSVASDMRAINKLDSQPDDYPIIGSNAYRSMLSVFDQRNDRFMDLPPERIGGHYGFRISPIASDVNVIQGRLKELDIVHDAPDDVINEMRRIMRRDLHAGQRLNYDNKKVLTELYQRAMRAFM